jgi:hypothetical protein
MRIEPNSHNVVNPTRALIASTSLVVSFVAPIIKQIGELKAHKWSMKGHKVTKGAPSSHQRTEKKIAHLKPK